MTRILSTWPATLACAAFAIAFGSGPLRAQTARAAGIQSQIHRFEQEIDKAGFRQRRLTHLRLRHLLGLPLRSANDDPARLTDAQRELVLLPNLQQERETALAEVESSVIELQRLGAELDAIAPGRHGVVGGSDHGQALAAPLAETGPGPRRGAHELQPQSARRPQRPVAHEDTAAATSEHPSGPEGGPLFGDASESGELVLIDGSGDDSLVGRTLLEAGVEMMRQQERMLAAGRPTEAEDLGRRAREHIERARTTLLRFADAPPGQNLVERFFLARAEERLGNYEAAYKLYLHVQQHDRVADGEGGVLGPWGRAADFASSVMRWRDDLSAFQPDLNVRVPWQDQADATTEAGR
jgi:hypothetical protein